MTVPCLLEAADKNLLNEKLKDPIELIKERREVIAGRGDVGGRRCRFPFHQPIASRFATETTPCLVSGLRHNHEFWLIQAAE